MTINRPDDLDDIANLLGLTVADGKRVLAGLQREIVCCASPRATRFSGQSTEAAVAFATKGLPEPCGRDASWPGDGASSPFSLCFGCDAIRLALVGRRIASRLGSAARVPKLLKWRLPPKGLPEPCGRDASWPGDGASSPFRCAGCDAMDWRWLAVVPVDAGIRPASSAFFRPDAVPGWPLTCLSRCFRLMPERILRPCADIP